MLGGEAYLQLHHLHLHQHQISKGGGLPKRSIHLELVSKVKQYKVFSNMEKDISLRASLKLFLPNNNKKS